LLKKEPSIAYPPIGSFTESYKRTSVSLAVGVNVGF
jgi:hypothetical protein